ncbi:hypothetical protein CBR_g30872 [Chara braunii]|uniref:Reverse transcriptase/retrotransposon-derived protein RNase H-like domain-containing protein n=1 Tax=Chara braunii TaxID=69332 RepID=A0A388LDQ5_CHABU|nr:hypothetical protein CBR_g30872 [Chara braunii]|eukprot:GBG80407.1 hypothetical protein CBR_g30872 [Chara braunii]
MFGEGPWITAILNYDGGDEVKLKINVEGAREEGMRAHSKLQAAITEVKDRAERRCRRDGVTAKMRVTVAYHKAETSTNTVNREQAHLDRDTGGESEMSEAADRETDVQSRKRADQVRRNHPQSSDYLSLHLALSGRDLMRTVQPCDEECESDSWCEAAFRHLKHALTHHEILKLPDPDKPLIVTMNASQYGIGAVLVQQEGPKLRPVEYMSKKMPS